MQETDISSSLKVSFLVAKVGMLSFCLTTLASALVVALLSSLQSERFPGLLDLTKTAILLCPIIAVSCGSFGLLAGILGSVILFHRRKRVHSRTRLLIEFGVVGLMLSLLFPLFDAVVNSSGGAGLVLNRAQLILVAPIGLSCATICGWAFRSHFISQANQPGGGLNGAR